MIPHQQPHGFPAFKATAGAAVKAVNEIPARHRNAVLLVDAGDTIEGTTMAHSVRANVYLDGVQTVQTADEPAFEMDGVSVLRGLERLVLVNAGDIRGAGGAGGAGRSWELHQLSPIYGQTGRGGGGGGGAGTPVGQGGLEGEEGHGGNDDGADGTASAGGTGGASDDGGFFVHNTYGEDGLDGSSAILVTNGELYLVNLGTVWGGGGGGAGGYGESGGPHVDAADGGGPGDDGNDVSPAVGGTGGAAVELAGTGSGAVITGSDTAMLKGSY